MKKTKLTILPVVLLSLLATACGGSGDKPSAASTPNNSSSAPIANDSSSEKADSASSVIEETPDSNSAAGETIEHASVDTSVIETGNVGIILDLNYADCDAPTIIQVKKGRKLVADQIPAVPTREGYLFNGWFETDNETDPMKAFSFRNAIRETVRLYAGWVDTSGEHERTEKVFEAEYARGIQDMSGKGYSGTATGKDLVLVDNGSFHASNDHFVTYLYGLGMSLDFEVYCSKAVTDAKFVARLSGEFMEVKLNPETYTISVNNSDLDYDEVVIDYTPGADHPFADFTISNGLKLKEGLNTISFISSTPLSSPVGTMEAMAPMIDCFKLTTDAVLTWLPESTNIDA